MEEAKKCPCGQTPLHLHVVDNGQGTKYASVYGSCCGEWLIEFSANYKALDSKECYELAVKAWNEAPRANK